MRTLTAFLLMLVIGWQLVNSLHGRFATRAPAKSIGRTDAAAEWLSGWGYRLRFATGQVANKVFVLRSHPTFETTERTELLMLKPWSPKREQAKAERMRKLLRLCGENGVETILLLVPHKILLVNEMPREFPMAGDLWSASTEVTEALWNERHDRKSYRDFHAAVSEYATDLLTPFLKEPTTPADPLFLPWDNHWTSRGIALAGEGVLDKLRARGWPIAPVTRTPMLLAPLVHQHDLLNQLQLPTNFLRSQPEFQWREPMYTLDVRAPTPPSGGRLVVVGSSFAGRLVDTEFSLGRMLARALNRELVDASYAGAGGRGSWLKLRADNFQFRRGDLLVMEYRNVPNDGDRALEEAATSYFTLPTRALSSTQR